jgi:hypothetical protein
MDMIIVVMACDAFIFAKSILYGVIRCRDRMDDAFLDESLQCPVNGYPIEFISTHFFNIRMRQRAIRMEEVVQDLFPAIGNTKLIPLKYV